LRVLVTGHRGRVGSVVEDALRRAGWDPVGFDRADGDDILAADRVATAARGCDAIAHIAALLGLQGETDEEILAVNLLGTWNVLKAADSAGVKRLVYLSSVNALGIFMGEGAPDYFPIDDEHPCRPGAAYGISKLLAEEMCQAFSRRTGIPTICLRPPAVLDDSVIESLKSAREKDPEFEWTPFWEYGCFIHVEDLAQATVCALTCPDPGHVRLLVNAEDISSSRGASREPGAFSAGGLASAGASDRPGASLRPLGARVAG
jgi:nucleoside-diphosphate-sugar epimerase